MRFLSSFSIRRFGGFNPPNRRIQSAESANWETAQKAFLNSLWWLTTAIHHQIVIVGAAPYSISSQNHFLRWFFDFIAETFFDVIFLIFPSTDFSEKSRIFRKKKFFFPKKLQIQITYFCDGREVLQFHDGQPFRMHSREASPITEFVHSRFWVPKTSFPNPPLNSPIGELNSPIGEFKRDNF